MASVSHDPGGLQSGDYPLLKRTVTLLSGQNLTRGAILGKITTGGKYTLSTTAASNGSQTPKAVLAVDAHADGADMTVPVYCSGEFAADQVTFGADHTAATVNAAFEAADIPIVIQTRA